MMNFIFVVLILLSIVFAIFSGNIDAVSNAVLSESVNAVELVLKILGGICFWNGIMNVAQKSNLTTAMGKFMYPVTGFLFKGLDKTSKAFAYITMNITVNLLGLGNAATPIGILAVQELAKEENAVPNVASNHMITFVVLNTASIQLLPTTIAFLRLEYGSASPLDILPAIWITSIVSVTSGLLMVALCKSWFDNKEGIHE